MSQQGSAAAADPRLSGRVQQFVMQNAPVLSIAVFFVATTLLVSLNTAITPMLNSQALDDVGHIAGTAASTIGAITFVGASLLSPLVDGAIVDTITPFALGYVVASAVASIAVAVAHRTRSTEPVTELAEA